ncbi:2-dehydropantoate 2-reductase N-terminal domain-containing protein [Paenibacillus sp. BR2-3]|uniref:2-dehydropantoate 2-reductase N-terminal domain-containing protein n=1 Tax=Paenibacillus sp. BR2-3 TaxID=3048494 RepID=UPI003977D3B6
MNFLIYGAGVIGSIFAGKLASAGYDVTVLIAKKYRRSRLLIALNRMMSTIIS